MTTAHPTPLEVLRGARELLADPQRWTQGWFAHDAYGNRVSPTSKEACRWCLDAALLKLSGGVAYESTGRILRAQLPRGYEYYSSFNDDSGHAEVLALLDRAIAEASRAEGSEG